MTLYWTHDPTGCFPAQGPFEEEIEAFMVASGQINDGAEYCDRLRLPMYILSGEYADTPEDQRVKVSEFLG